MLYQNNCFNDIIKHNKKQMFEKSKDQYFYNLNGLMDISWKALIKLYVNFQKL